MIYENIEFLAKYDADVADAVKKELERQQNGIELIASENFVSEAVLAANSSVLTNKYAEGYPGKRYYGGCEFVDVVENLAIERVKKLFGAAYANVQPHSGAQDLTHGSPVNFSGLFFNFVSYGVDPDTGRIDYDAVEKLARENKPKIIVAGASAYPRVIDFERFADIAHRNGALLMVDMAHIAGLVAAGVHPSPVPYADIVTSTTHKTLRGPRGGLILTNNEEYAKKINKAIFPGTQGGPLMHTIAAKAVCFGEALSEGFAAYQKQIVKNASAFANALSAQGFDMVSGGTDNHLILLDLRNFSITGKELEKRLDSVHITANKNAIPNDPQSPFITSGLRLGTPAATTRGLKEDDFVTLARLIRLCTGDDFEEKADYIRSEVALICEKYPLYPKS